MAFDISDVSSDLNTLGVNSSRLREIIGGHTSAQDFANKAIKEVLVELSIPINLRPEFDKGLLDFLKKSNPVIRAIDYLSEKLEGVIESAGDTVKGIVQKTIEGFTKLKDEFKKDIESLIGKLDSSVENLFDKLNQFRTETILGLRAIVGEVNTALEERINQLAKAAAEILVKAKDFVSFAADEFRKKLFDPVLDRVEKIGDKLFADANKLVDKIFERVDLLVDKVFKKSGDFVQLVNDLTVEEAQRSIEKVKADMNINPILIFFDPNKKRRAATFTLNSVQNIATTAQTTANTANATANTAVELANTAQSAASNAQTTANGAMNLSHQINDRTQKIHFDGNSTIIDAGDKFLSIQCDGNVVVYRDDGVPLWDTGSSYRQ